MVTCPPPLSAKKSNYYKYYTSVSLIVMSKKITLANQ